MKIKELLPIGSIVLLEGGTKRLMVFGVKQKDIKTDIEYDYTGVLYPEGNMGQGSFFMFNYDKIREVVYRGYEDEERQEFITKLAEYYETGE